MTADGKFSQEKKVRRPGLSFNKNAIRMRELRKDPEYRRRENERRRERRKAAKAKKKAEKLKENTDAVYLIRVRY